MCTMKQPLIYCPTMKWSGQMMSVEKLRGNMGIGSFEIAASCGCLWAHVTLKALSKIMWWLKPLHINLETWMTNLTNTRTNRRQLAKVVILLLTQTGQLKLLVMTLPDQWSMNGTEFQNNLFMGQLYRTHSYSFLIDSYLFIYLFFIVLTFFIRNCLATK